MKFYPVFIRMPSLMRTEAGVALPADLQNNSILHWPGQGLFHGSGVSYVGWGEGGGGSQCRCN